MPINMSGATAPPRKRASASRAPTRQPEAAPTMDPRAQSLVEISALGQAALMFFGQHADAAALNMHFPPLAHAVADYAKTYEPLAKGIDMLGAASPFLAMAMAGLPLAFQIAVNHGWADAAKVRLNGIDVVPPEILKARVEVQIAQLQAATLVEQADQQRQIEELRRQANEIIASANGSAPSAAV